MVYRTYSSLLLLGFALGTASSADAAEPVASIVPSNGRVVGLLEWVQAEIIVGNETLDLDKCELTLKGPDGIVSGETSREGRLLKFKPTGTKHLAVNDPAVIHDGPVLKRKFTGATVGVTALKGPFGAAWDWSIDGGAQRRGRLDLYLPSDRVGYARWSPRPFPLLGMTEPGVHELVLTPAKSHPEQHAGRRPHYWLESKLDGFIVSPLRPGAYTATAIARAKDGAELGRESARFTIAPKYASGVTGAIASDGVYNIFLEGTSPRITCSAVNGTDRELRVRPTVKITDYWGNTTQLGADFAKVEAGGTGAWELSWPQPKPGWYLWTMELRTEDGQDLLLEIPKTAAILPKAEGRILEVPPYESVFCQDWIPARIPDPVDKLLSILQMAGIQNVHNVSPSVSTAKRDQGYGLTPGINSYVGPALHGHVDWRDPAGAISTMRKDAKDQTDSMVPGALYTSGDERNVFGTYNYSIWAAGQKISGLALGKHDPQAQFTPTQAGAATDIDLFWGIAEQGGWPDVDVLNVHIYLPPAALRESLDMYDWMLRRLGMKPGFVGLWNTVDAPGPNPVSAYPFDLSYLDRLRGHADIALEQRVIARRYPWVKRIWHWNSSDWRDCKIHSLLYWDKTPRPALLAVATTSWKLGGARYVAKLDMPDANAHADVFDRQGQAVIVLRVNEDAQVVIDGVEGDAQVTDLMGNTRTVAADGSLTLQLKQHQPIFVEPADKAVLAQAYMNAERKLKAEAYWRKHVAIFYAGPGRGTRRGEILINAGKAYDLKIWIANEGDQALKGTLRLTDEQVEHPWHGTPMVKAADNRRQSFEVNPGEQAVVQFSLKANENAQTFNATFRTHAYLQVGADRIFLDPIKIDVIVVAKPKP